MSGNYKNPKEDEMNKKYKIGKVIFRSLFLFVYALAPVYLMGAMDLGCNYNTGISVFDENGTVLTGEKNTKIHQGEGNYNIGVNPSNLQIQGNAEQCVDSTGSHTCVGNSEYGLKIDLGVFPAMPASGNSQTLDDINDNLNSNKNNIIIENLNGVNTVSIPNSVINEIYSLTIQNGADVKLVYDGTDPFKIKTLSMNSSGTLYMEPGTYYVENFSIQSGADIVVTGTGDGSGTVRLLVQNSITLSAGSSYYNYDSSLSPTAQLPEKLFIASYTGNITVQAGAYVSAYLYSDNGDISVNAGPTTFVGGAVANNIYFQDSVDFYYLSDHLLEDGVCGGGTTPPISSAYANVDVVDGYSGSGADYKSWIKTKVSNKDAYTLTAVYLGKDSTNPVPQAYAPSANANQSASLTILYKLADMSNGATCQNAPTVNLTTTLGGNTPVVSIIDPNEVNASSNAFTMGYVQSGVIPLSKRNLKIKYKSVDFNQLIIDSGIQCAQKSSTGGVVEGIPSCLIAQPNDNTENQNKAIQRYKTIFGDSAYTSCYTQNGEPCASSNGGVGEAPYDHEYGCFECSIGNMPYVCSNDNFAIRPEKLVIAKTHIAGDDWPNLLRSAEDYNVSINAYNYNTTTNSMDYNVTDANATYTIVSTKYNRNNVVTPSMAGIVSFDANGFDMANGISVKTGIIGNEVAGISFDDVGKINISVQDQNWSAVDIDNANDPTPHDCSPNGAYVCGDKNVTYIPHHFDFNELSITNNNGNPGSFTYIANEVDQMAGRIHTKIRALNKLEAVTQNFAQFPLWENNVTVVPTVVKSTYLYPDANETNITTLAIGFGSGTDANGTKTIAWNETNTSQYLRFNFQRDVNQAVNPFDVNGTDLNISITSLYTDTEDSDMANIVGSRLGTGIQNLPYVVVLPATGDSNFIYGRIIPRDVRVFGDVSFSANAWYEAFNAPTLGGIALPASRNEALWYTNTQHNDNNDGDGNVTRLQSAPTVSTAVNVGGDDVNGMETYNFGAVADANIPYSRKAHIDTAPWLWYGTNAQDYLDPSNANLDCRTHPCFNINVVPSVGATGSAKTSNKETKGSKKTDSGGGTWKSTSDYAPAIR
jgi:hypothetical protein